MRKVFQNAGDFLCYVIDFFYPPFRKYMNVQFFRYAATGAMNVGVSLVLYYIAYHYVLKQQMLHLGIVTMSSHIAALAITFPVSNFFGFLLQKYVTFTESELRGHTQLYRYFMVVFINLIINYLFMKLLVDKLCFWPMPSQIIATGCCILISYFSQKRFTFKTHKS